jgi:hypothetical protein
METQVKFLIDEDIHYGKLVSLNIPYGILCERYWLTVIEITIPDSALMRTSHHGCITK